MKLCIECGEPTPGSRCPDHELPRPVKASREARGYDSAWRRLSIRARELQPWCSVCGTTEDLTADHLQWPATTLKHVDVLCRTCNARKGAPTADNDPRGKTLPAPPGHPGGKAFSSTQFMHMHVSEEVERG